MELTQRLAHSFRCMHSTQPLLHEALPRKRTLEAAVDSSPTTARAYTLRESSNSTASSSGLAYKHSFFVCHLGEFANSKKSAKSGCTATARWPEVEGSCEPPHLTTLVDKAAASTRPSSSQTEKWQRVRESKRGAREGGKKSRRATPEAVRRGSWRGRWKWWKWRWRGGLCRRSERSCCGGCPGR